MKVISIRITPLEERFLLEAVAKGFYPSVSAAVAGGLRADLVFYGGAYRRWEDGSRLELARRMKQERDASGCRARSKSKAK